jgi:hypothetical protein
VTDQPERTRWTFSAGPKACTPCRNLDGQEAESGSEQYKFLSSAMHGCARGQWCRCGCTMKGVSVR